jgi:DNA-binding PadR family transcriptional regulator
LPHKKHRGHFWSAWDEDQDSGDHTAADFEHHHKVAWRSHFTDFLGVPPERHWLFGGRRFKPWVSGRWGPPGMFNPFLAILMSKGGGLLSLYVLHLLSEKPRYGNDIMRQIEERTQHRWASNPGAIYPLLTAMEESDLVEGDWEDPDKRTRRIYRLTSEGRQEFERVKEVMRPKLEEAIRLLGDIYDDLRIDEEI